MTADEIRKWLGAYVLILVVILGAYLFLAGGSWLLPLEAEDVTSTCQIIIPFLLAQVVTVYRFFTQDRPPRDVGGMPRFFVKAPLLLATGVMGVAMLAIAVGGYTGAEWTPSGGQFKKVVTFVVSLLNASTVFVITRYFEGRPPSDLDQTATLGKETGLAGPGADSNPESKAIVSPVDKGGLTSP